MDPEILKIRLIGYGMVIAMAVLVWFLHGLN